MRASNAARAAEGRFDAVIAIFFLHHLPDDELAALPHQLREQLPEGGVFYSLDPSRHRLSGVVGRLLIPGLMKKYQTEDERELEPSETAALFRNAGWEAQVSMYDFGSSPLAGFFRDGRAGTAWRGRWTMGYCEWVRWRGGEVISRCGAGLGKISRDILAADERRKGKKSQDFSVSSALIGGLLLYRTM